MRNAAIASSALAPVALIGGWTWAAARQPAGFDPWRDTISALAADGATDRWIMTGGLAGLGMCHLITAAGLPEIGPAGRATLAAGGATALGVALLPQPNAGHIPVATASFVALAVWPAVSTLRPRWAALATTALLGALVGWLTVAIKTDDLVGLSERVAAGAEALAPLAVVLTALSRRRRLA